MSHSRPCRRICVFRESRVAGAGSRGLVSGKMKIKRGHYGNSWCPADDRRTYCPGHCGMLQGLKEKEREAVGSHTGSKLTDHD